MKKYLLLTLLTLLPLTGCSPSDTVIESTITNAIFFNGVTSMSYTILGSEPRKSFVDVVSVDGNAIKVKSSDSITGEYETDQKAINYIYNYDCTIVLIAVNANAMSVFFI